MLFIEAKQSYQIPTGHVHVVQHMAVSIRGTEGRSKAALANLFSGVNSDGGRGLIQFHSEYSVSGRSRWNCD